MCQKSRIMQIVQHYTIFLSQNFWCFNLVSLQIFFGFTFNKKLSIFKVKTGKKVALPPSESKQGTSVIG